MINSKGVKIYMCVIKIGELRKWNYDTENTNIFKIENYKSFFINQHYYIIEYIKDDRKQTVSKDDLLNESVVITNY
jgi:hypothetical protein